ATALVPLTARLVPPADADRLPEVEIRVNGEKADVAVKWDERRETLTAAVPVKPGDNRIQVRLSNKWGAVVLSDPARVRYARPPIVKLEQVPGAKAPLHDFRAEVRSPLELLPKSIVVEVNGKARPAQVPPPAATGKGTWEVRVKGLALEDGTNEVRLRVSNAEGECLKP